MEAIDLAQTILRQWTAAIAVRDLDSLAQMFAENAVLIATAPAPLRGRAAILTYYAAAPVGLTAHAELVIATLQTQSLSIVADVAFDVPNQGTIGGTLSLACTANGLITLYHMALTPAQR